MTCEVKCPIRNPISLSFISYHNKLVFTIFLLLTVNIGKILFCSCHSARSTAGHDTSARTIKNKKRDMVNRMMVTQSAKV